jgi:hypothetical protein
VGYYCGEIKDVIFEGADYGQHGTYYRFLNISVTVQDQVTVTLPSGMEAVGILSLTKIESSAIRTPIENTIRFWQQSGDAVTIDVDGSVNEGDVVEVELYVNKVFALFDLPSKSIISICETKEVEVTIISGTGRYYFEELEYAYHTPPNMIDGNANIKVVDPNGGNVTQHGIVEGTVSPEEWYVEVSDVPYASVNDGGTVKVTLTVEKTIKNDDFLRYCYNYIPYVGKAQNWAPQEVPWWLFKGQAGVTTRGTGYVDRSKFISQDKPAILQNLPGKRSWDYLSGENEPTDLLIANLYESATILDNNVRISQIDNLGNDVGAQFNLFKFMDSSNVTSVERGFSLNINFIDRGLEGEYSNGIEAFIGSALSDRLDNAITWEDTKKVRFFLTAVSKDSEPGMLIIVGSEYINIGVSGSYDFAIADVFNLLGRPLVK